MLPTRDDEDEEGERMYSERQRPFLALVSLTQLNTQLRDRTSIPEVVRAVFVSDQEDGNLRVVFNRVDAV